MKRKVNEVKNGEYTVMTGTVTEKFGTFTGRYRVYYFRVRDERGVEEEYQISHRPSYRKAEVGHSGHGCGTDVIMEKQMYILWLL